MSQRTDVVKEFYEKLCKVAGVTQQGDKFTARWTRDNQLVSVSLIVIAVTTPTDAKALGARSDRYQKLFAKHPELEADIFYAETGEWPK